MFGAGHRANSEYELQGKEEEQQYEHRGRHYDDHKPQR